MKLYEYAIRRLGLMIIVLFGVSVITFYVTRGISSPVYAISAYLTPRMTDLQKLQTAVSVGVATSSCPSFSAFIAREPGCIVPIYVQYFSWLQNIVFKGNWGQSQIPGIGTGQLTWVLFATRFPYTAQLAIASLILTVAAGLPLGIISATHNNKWPDHTSRLIALIGYSMPYFWLAFLFQIFFVLYIRIPSGAVSLPLLPSSGTLGSSCAVCFSNPGTVTSYTGLTILDGLLSGNFPYSWDSFVGLILPTLTIVLSSIGALTRIVRSSMVEALHQDYVILARSKGLAERVVVYKHALKNAMLPALTISGLLFAGLLGGVVITEYIFAYPGIGAAGVEAADFFDINYLELYTLVTALIIVVANLIVDILYAYIDPRIRY
jgi:ABC-type dipeptide/oligopeptide/nickel transport system permease component